MTFDEVNAMIDQPMEHDIQRGIDYCIIFYDIALILSIYLLIR
jgi:hypothetical protein